MKLYYWNKAPNFGDELNAVLWPALLGNLLNNGDETLFVGIGTLLNQELPRDVFKIVFGTGSGYGAPPRIDGTFDILCVRGPFTANSLGLPAESIVTDSALLARKLAWTQASVTAPSIMIPHWQSAAFVDWPEICREAGVHYTDPRLSPDAVIADIRAASLVITESLHGAILADAFRIPWIPVALYHQINRAKWEDWTATHDVAYEPRSLAAPYDDYFAHPERCEHYRRLSTGRLALLRKAFFRLERAGWQRQQGKLRRQLIRELRELGQSNKTYLSAATRSDDLFHELERRLETFLGNFCKGSGDAALRRR